MTPNGKRNPNRVFTRKAMRAFESYIRTVGLPETDRALLAAMVCSVGPNLNPGFRKDLFLRNCHVKPETLSGSVKPGTQETADERKQTA